jgi:hypothetical protein
MAASCRRLIPAVRVAVFFVMTLLTEFKEAVIIAWAALRANKVRDGLIAADEVNPNPRATKRMEAMAV